VRGRRRATFLDMSVAARYSRCTAARCRHGHRLLLCLEDDTPPMIHHFRWALASAQLTYAMTSTLPWVLGAETTEANRFEKHIQ